MSLTAAFSVAENLIERINAGSVVLKSEVKNLESAVEVLCWNSDSDISQMLSDRFDWIVIKTDYEN